MPSPKRRKKRRIRSPHPGVKLNGRRLPSGRMQWRARFIDPDTKRATDVTLDAVELPNHEARRLWAVRKSKALAKLRMRIDEVGPRSAPTGLQEAVTDYLAGGKHRLRARTLVTYRLAIDQLTAWAAREGVASTADLTRARLTGFRDHLIAKPRRAAVKGGRRGEARELDRKRSAVSVNRELRTLKTVLNTWRTAGRLPQLDRDAIADTLKTLPVPREQPAYLTPAKLDKLIGAAVKHDARTFKMTRKEKEAGKARTGSTQRHVPITSFVLFLLLTGCRRGEALGLKWSDVDLEATDHEGRTVGEIRLRAEDTKTHRARTIGLEVSPALRVLLAAMKLRAGKEAETAHVFELPAWARDPEQEGPQPYTVDLIETARDRMKGLGAPKDFDWQMLRSTCGTYLTNAPGIWGSATVFMSAKQLGHSVVVAERHYLGVHRGIPKDAHTLEAAMQIESQVKGAVTAAERTRPALISAV
jgi:integrase